MSLSSALSVALTGLQTSSTIMQVVSNNIANAQTPGYTKKSVTLTSTELGAGNSGGAGIAGYTRASNDVLQKSFNTATSDAALADTQNTYMQQVQTILNSNSNNPALSEAIAKFSSSWTQLQAAPEDPTIQQAVVQAGSAFAKVVNTIANQVSALSTQVSNDIGNTVTQLNSYLSQVYTLNQQIFTATNQNVPTGNLEDERDQLINQISSITSVTVFPRLQGQIALYTPDGVALLDGQVQEFTYDGTDVLNAGGVVVTSDVVGGSLQAQIQFNATATTPSSLPAVNTIQKLQAQLVDLVAVFTTNSAGPPQTFANAYNPTSAANSDFFTATGNDPTLFAVRAALVSDPTGIPAANVAAVATTFSSNYNLSDAAAGISFPSGTPAAFVTTILAGFQQAANTIKTQNESAVQQKSYYEQVLSNATGVNVDDELVSLTTLQNSYAASAHVISTISEMFKDLLAII